VGVYKLRENTVRYGHNDVGVAVPPAVLIPIESGVTSNKATFLGEMALQM